MWEAFLNSLYNVMKATKEYAISRYSSTFKLDYKHEFSKTDFRFQSVAQQLLYAGNYMVSVWVKLEIMIKMFKGKYKYNSETWLISTIWITSILTLCNVILILFQKTLNFVMQRCSTLDINWFQSDIWNWNIFRPFPQYQT